MEKRNSNLPSSPGHKIQCWFEPSVNHHTNLWDSKKKKKSRCAKKEKQWGSPSFVCEPAWLGFAICISRLLLFFFLFFYCFEAGGWQKHQSPQAHCVAHMLWHTPLVGSIQYNHTFLFSARCSTSEYDSKGSWKTSVHCCLVLLL